MKQRWLWSCAALALAGCGYAERNDGSLPQDLRLAEDVDMAKVSFSYEVAPLFTPASPPPANGNLSSLKMDFKVKIDASSVAGFTYDRNNWKVAFRKGDAGDLWEFSGTVKSVGQSSLSGRQGTVQVTLELSFPDGKLPTDLEKMISENESSNKRRMVYAIPIYRTGNKDNDKKLSAAKWAADEGVMLGGPGLTMIRAGDGTLVVEWREPTQKASLKREADGSFSQLPVPSSVSGYVLALWNLEECPNGGWDFQVNPEIQGSSPGRALACTFAASDGAVVPEEVKTTQCALGCGTEADPALGNRSEDEAAIPALIPTEVGSVRKVGCYSVVRVAKRSGEISSYSFGRLTNGQKYGVVAWALDSAGHLSLGRSGCGFGTPITIPLPADGKTGGEKRTQSDCFVATAASGSRSSNAVMYWRIIRDRVLGNGRFVEWYYREGPRLARMLDAHPVWKAPVNAVLTATGWLGTKAISLSDGFEPFLGRLEGLWKRLWSSLFFDIAYGAQEAPGVSMQVSALGGMTDMTTEGNVWDAYYRSVKPFRLMLAHSYSVLETPFGELGLGAELSYFTARGRTPAQAPNATKIAREAVGAWQTSNAVGFGGLISQRLFIPAVPWIAAHFSLSMGATRLRMEAPTLRQSGASDSPPPSPWGYTLWKPILGARAATELFWGSLFSSDIAEARFAYGLSDVGLVAFLEYTKDFSDSLSMDALSYGAGITFLFD